ncbi:GIN domain-containing protein [Flavobacterium sp.]|uniref:GIN domain-containing protein n=1 Tax=Flavobacterium sp. TaxID=239 RepID=UPI002B4B70A8|nr:DUF2807 domain-containing protein [Flavobacterium sp.]HLP63997.1 DUF2807 domain-containing protein [Flavobacterium sp.]
MTKLILAIVMIVTSTFANAQLKGSGKTITKNFDYTNFDKVYFEDLDGKLEVEIGKSWSISVTVDDNLESLLAFKENPTEHELTVYLKGNKNNRMYIENSNIKIKITMPEATVIRNDSNANLVINGVIGRYFRLENFSNSTSKVLGTVDELEVKNTGNGNSNLAELKAKKANIICRGNGNTTVNVSEEIVATVSGNGNITNKGNANYDGKSSRTGNGNLLK